jgi:hypothetical protein
MIESPSEYELAVKEAVASAGKVVALVYCRDHGGEVGQIRYSPHGRLFCAEVPVESGTGIERHLKQLREETRRRPPPAMYQVRVLLNRIEEAEHLPPMALCKRGRHRIIAQASDFQSHEGATLRVKPV